MRHVDDTDDSPGRAAAIAKRIELLGRRHGSDLGEADEPFDVHTAIVAAEADRLAVRGPEMRQQMADDITAHRPPRLPVPDDTGIGSQIGGWASAEQVATLILSGPTGTGKTSWAWEALRQAALARNIWSEHSRTWEAVSAVGLFRGSDADRARMATVPLLLIDDLGQEPMGTEYQRETSRALWWELLDARYNHARLTIITTHLGGAKVPDWQDRATEEVATIRGRYGDAVWSRLHPLVVVRVKGPDRRLTL